MVKFILAALLMLALIGGAIELKSNDKDWALVVNKEAAVNSIPNGAMRIYNFFKNFIEGEDKIKSTTLTKEK